MDGCALVNIGVQQFDKLREEKKFYIDKTSFIREWWEKGADVTLITRPRRFGKTLNMSMLECFFSNRFAGRGDLFEGLSIWQGQADSEKYRQLQGTYPVIFLSFAGVKSGDGREIKAAFKQVIADIYDHFRDVVQSNALNENNREYFASVSDGMEDSVALISIKRLCMYLEKCYGKRAIVLLDEYDTPMQAAWLNGCWDETVPFFRDFFENTFKNNPHLHRGIITGITRIAKESIFSDLNNLDVITTTSDEYATCFGFTQKEVSAALDAAGLGGEKQGVKDWYDGFTFGSHTDIYNPWSITSFIGKKGRYKAYWTNTSGNGLVNLLVQSGTPDVKQGMEELLRGKSLSVQIDEQIVFDQLGSSANAVWSLLLATGYLKVLAVENIGEYRDEYYTLTLTNLEVTRMFRDMVGGWFQSNLKIPYNEFVRALLANDAESMNEFMNDIALQSFSNFDTAKGASSKDAPERFYHGFVLGLMVGLEGRYHITSNRESGFGRYDIMLTPVNREKEDAYIIEFKVHRPKRETDLKETAANALRQIEDRQYAAQLIAEGIAPERIKKYGFAFKGKNCLIVQGDSTHEKHL